MARPAIHAGEILSDELEELGISASELAGEEIQKTIQPRSSFTQSLSKLYRHQAF